MKRYKGEVVVYWLEGAKVEMKEDPEGEWVKRKDSEEEICRVSEIYENRIRELKREINHLKTITGTGVKSPRGMLIQGEALNYPKCNCEKMARDALPGSYWLCPAHGYKKR